MLTADEVQTLRAGLDRLHATFKRGEATLREHLPIIEDIGRGMDAGPAALQAVLHEHGDAAYRAIGLAIVATRLVLELRDGERLYATLTGGEHGTC